MLRRLLVLFFLGFISACSSAPDFTITPEQEAFSQNVTYNDKIDILWVVDNSRSMEKHQLRLIDEAAQYISRLDELSWDYRIAVTTMDYSTGGLGGTLIGSNDFISPNDENRVFEFQKRILQGEGGSNRETGLRAIYDLVSRDTEFIRDEAFLVINVISDEEDFSEVTTQNVYDLVQMKKASATDFDMPWMMNFIGVLDTSGTCRTFERRKSPN
jgi:hypothetical protein